MEDPGPTRTLVYEDRQVDASKGFHVTPGPGMNFPGPGSLDALLLVADADAFGVRVESEEATLVDDYYADLEPWSDELVHIDAYTTTDDDRVISVTDFGYREMVRAKVLVEDDVSFDRVRAVYTIGREIDY